MKTFFPGLCLIVLLLTWPDAASAANYYVSTSGSNSHDGLSIATHGELCSGPRTTSPPVTL